MEAQSRIPSCISDSCILIGGQPRSGTTLLSSILRSSENHFQAFELHIRKPSFLVGLEGKYTRRIFAGLGLPEKEFDEIKTLVPLAEMNLGAWVGPREKVSAEPLSGKETTNFLQELKARSWLTTLLMRRVTELSGKSSWGFKILGDIVFADKYCSIWPNATFILIVRDPRDYALSILELNKQRQARKQPCFYEDVAEAVKGWRETIEKARVVAQSTQVKMIEIRYEDLVTNTSAEIKRISTRLNLDLSSGLKFYQQDFVMEHTQRFKHHNNLLKPINSNSVGKWENQMQVKDAESCWQIAGHLMEEFGYY